MELKSGDLFFFLKKFLWKDHRCDREEKMEKTKAQKEVNFELFKAE